MLHLKLASGIGDSEILRRHVDESLQDIEHALPENSMGPPVPGTVEYE